MEIQGQPDYQIRETPELLAAFRHDGERIISTVVSLLDGGHVVVLDCGHPLGREHEGKFHLIQLESHMFTVVCNQCTGFAMLGEVIEGAGIPYLSAKA